jgi:hypothetical protein
LRFNYNKIKEGNSENTITTTINSNANHWKYILINKILIIFIDFYSQIPLKNNILFNIYFFVVKIMLI